jgi:hypothetical protein
MNETYVLISHSRVSGTNDERTDFVGAGRKFDQVADMMRPEASVRKYTVFRLDANLKKIQTWRYIVRWKRNRIEYELLMQ